MAVVLCRIIVATGPLIHLCKDRVADILQFLELIFLGVRVVVERVVGVPHSLLDLALVAQLAVGGAHLEDAVVDGEHADVERRGPRAGRSSPPPRPC